MTSDDNPLTYEKLRNKIADLKPADLDQRRTLVWCSDNQTLAASRGISGELEIFILGPALSADSPVVQEILSHDTWKRSDGTTITASRLVLPPADPFDAVTTFLCVELLRNGVDTNRQKALTASEPIFETVLQRLHLHNEGILGLLGELLIIRQLIRSKPSNLAHILESWHGNDRSARDLQLSGAGIEIKTTRRATSTHDIQGVRQVELGHAVGGVHETHLLLVSLGLEPPDDNGVGHSLPTLVDSILDLISEHAGDGAEKTAGAFIASVKSYGSASNDGYDHEHMRDRALFAQTWNLSFARAYDMTDPAVLVLRSSDIAPRTMVDLDTVTFRINLPAQVTGDINPVTGLQDVTTAIIDAWHPV